jgi:hypothetical protein
MDAAQRLAQAGGVPHPFHAARDPQGGRQQLELLVSRNRPQHAQPQPPMPLRQERRGAHHVRCPSQRRPRRHARQDGGCGAVGRWRLARRRRSRMPRVPDLLLRAKLRAHRRQRPARRRVSGRGGLAGIQVPARHQPLGPAPAPSRGERFARRHAPHHTAAPRLAHGQGGRQLLAVVVHEHHVHEVARELRAHHRGVAARRATLRQWQERRAALHRLRRRLAAGRRRKPRLVSALGQRACHRGKNARGSIPRRAAMQEEDAHHQAGDASRALATARAASTNCSACSRAYVPPAAISASCVPCSTTRPRSSTRICDAC